MSEACAPNVVQEVAGGAFEMGPREVLRVMRLCAAMDSGWQIGQQQAIPGEPLPLAEDGKDPKPLEEVETLPEPEVFAAEILDKLDGLGVFAGKLRELDPDVVWSLAGTLKDCGVEPFDLLPLPALDRLAMDEAGRPWEMTPLYFVAMVERPAKEAMLRNILDPETLAAARRPFEFPEAVA